MWTKVKFEKNKEKSNEEEIFGVVTAVWEESTPNEVVYQEFINVKTEINNFCQNANNSKEKILSEKSTIEQIKEEQGNFSEEILLALNK